MKPVTPASYQRIFNIGSSLLGVTLSGATLGTRGLLITTTAVGSVSLVTVGADNPLSANAVQITNIPANTVFVLPVAVLKVTAVNSDTTTKIWGLA